MPKKLSKEEVVLRLDERFKCKFTYDLSTYQNIRSYIKVTCPTHGRWKTTPLQLMTSKYGCKRCSKLQAKKVGIPLLKNDPLLAKEWDTERNGPIGNTERTLKIRVWWKCSQCNHGWSTTPNCRYIDETGCPICSGRSRVTKESSFGLNAPDHLLKEWCDARNPNLFSKFSNVKASWKCTECDYVWGAKIAQRTSGKHNCPRCRVRKENAQLEATRFSLVAPKELQDEWADERSMHDCSIKSATKVKWRCKDCQGIWEQRIDSRVNTFPNSKCRICDGKVVVDRTRFSTNVPQYLLQEWNDTMDVNDISIYSTYKAKWRCITCDFRWKDQVINRTKNMGCCPNCVIDIQHSRAARELGDFMSLLETDMLDDLFNNK
jgi:hypothetical protein